MSPFRNVKFQYAKILAKRSDNTQISLHNRLTILLNQTLQLPLLFCVVFWKWDLTMWQVIQKRMGVTKASNFNVNHPFISEFKINIPGSSRYVKFLPFGRFLLVKRHKFYTLGRSRYIFYSHMLRGSSRSVRGSDIAKNRTKMAPRKLAEANF